jgi:5-(carboxyamino)imidazole ribonucleotide mutase
MSAAPIVSIIMGSDSDLSTLSAAAEVLTSLGVPHEVRIVSAHRTPEWMVDFARTAAGRGIRAIIAGAGGAAHLPGMVSALTELPVLGVPVVTASSPLGGVDALLSIVQMPAGVPTATFALGRAGAANAGHFAARMLALSDEALAGRVRAHRAALVEKVTEADAKLQRERKGGA